MIFARIIFLGTHILSPPVSLVDTHTHTDKMHSRFHAPQARYTIYLHVALKTNKYMRACECDCVCAVHFGGERCIKITYAAKLFKVVFVLFEDFNIHYFRNGKGNRKYIW